MDPPLVSIVIPTYNYGHFVRDAVKSVLAQSYPNIEVIVIDDGSTDDTRERLNSFGDRVHYHFQENAGLAAARNAGMRLAKGEWIAFLDSDDIWHRHKLEVQLGAIADRSAALIGSPSTHHLQEELPDRSTVRVLSIRELLSSTPLGPSGALVRAACLRTIGMFDTTIPGGCVEDRDLWLRLTARYPAYIVECDCWWYRPHDGQMSKSPRPMYDSLRWVIGNFLKSHPEHMALSSLAYGFLYADAATAFYQSGRRWTGLLLMVRSFIVYPWPTLFVPRRSVLRTRPRLFVRMILGESVFRGLRRLIRVE